MRECVLRSGVILEGTSKEKRVKPGVGVLFFFFEVWGSGMAVSVTEAAMVLMCNCHDHFTSL